MEYFEKFQLKKNSILRHIFDNQPEIIQFENVYKNDLNEKYSSSCKKAYFSQNWKKSNQNLKMRKYSMENRNFFLA